MGLITWYAGFIKANQDEINFQTGTIIAALNGVDDAHINNRLNLLLKTQLIKGDLAQKVKEYLDTNKQSSEK